MGARHIARRVSEPLLRCHVLCQHSPCPLRPARASPARLALGGRVFVLIRRRRASSGSLAAHRRCCWRLLGTAAAAGARLLPCRCCGCGCCLLLLLLLPGCHQLCCQVNAEVFQCTQPADADNACVCTQLQNALSASLVATRHKLQLGQAHTAALRALDRLVGPLAQPATTCPAPAHRPPGPVPPLMPPAACSFRYSACWRSRSSCRLRASCEVDG